jgi:hypothetical protein
MNNNIHLQQNVIAGYKIPVVLLLISVCRWNIKKEGRHPDDQSSNFKNLIP